MNSGFQTILRSAVACVAAACLFALAWSALANSEARQVAKATVNESESLSPQEVLHFLDDAGKRQPVTSAEQWAKRRPNLLASMELVMGPLPSREDELPLDVQTLHVEQASKYERRTIAYVSEPGERVPAFLLIPHGLSARAPAMLCLHQTTPGGKKSPAGLTDRATLHYAHELAERGYVCIVPDYPSFGDYAYDFAKADKYASGTMKAIWNNQRAVDVLESLTEVDSKRIGVIGHSLGGHNALFTAAFEPRLAAVITSCGFTSFARYYEGDLKGWTSDRYMPRIADIYHNNAAEMPFDFHGVLAAIAPRAVFVSAPLRDDNFDVQGVRDVEAEVKRVFELLKAPDQMLFEYPDSAHDFPDAVRERAYRWLEQTLK